MPHARLRTTLPDMPVDRAALRAPSSRTRASATPRGSTAARERSALASPSSARPSDLNRPPINRDRRGPYRQFRQPRPAALQTAGNPAARTPRHQLGSRDRPATGRSTGLHPQRSVDPAVQPAAEPQPAAPTAPTGRVGDAATECWVVRTSLGIAVPRSRPPSHPPYSICPRTRQATGLARSEGQSVACWAAVQSLPPECRLRA